MLFRRLVSAGANPNLMGMEHTVRILRGGIDTMLWAPACIVTLPPKCSYAILRFED